MMKIHSIILSIFLSIGVWGGCMTSPSNESLSKVLNSNKSTIVLIHNQGTLGNTSMRYESEERFEVYKGKDEIKVEYYQPVYFTDSIFKFDLIENEIDSLFMVLKHSIKTHNPNKVYESCCVCSTIDFLIYNDDIKMEVKPSDETLKLFYKLTGKYSKIIQEKERESRLIKE